MQVRQSRGDSLRGRVRGGRRTVRRSPRLRRLRLRSASPCPLRPRRIGKAPHRRLWIRTSRCRRYLSSGTLPRPGFLLLVMWGVRRPSMRSLDRGRILLRLPMLFRRLYLKCNHHRRRRQRRMSSNHYSSLALDRVSPWRVGVETDLLFQFPLYRVLLTRHRPRHRRYVHSRGARPRRLRI